MSALPVIPLIRGDRGQLRAWLQVEEKLESGAELVRLSWCGRRDLTEWIVVGDAEFPRDAIDGWVQRCRQATVRIF